VTAAGGQSLDDIEAVEFPAAAGHLRQIPARRWRRSPNPIPPGQHAPTVEDVVDGPLRGQRFDAVGLEGIEDHLGPEETEITPACNRRRTSRTNSSAGAVLR
jgi:hypothetical protein